MNNHTWHPCSQMKDYESFVPLEIVRAEKEILYTADGKEIIDAISSWWCKSLGHNHPEIKEAVYAQMNKFEHVILANTTNRVIEELSERLSSFYPELNRVFYGCDGSTALEIAVKLALFAQKLSGKPEKSKFMALENGYHGETAFTLGLSDLGIYKDPFKEILPDVDMIGNIPYISGSDDPLWNNADASWAEILPQLEKNKDSLAAIVVEPIVQGAGGMMIYSPDFLKKLSAWTKKNNVFLIADEIMTGLGRTGTALASYHAGITPDIVCLSKGLTAGWLPMSAVLIKNDIYSLFYDDYEKGKNFLHSNTYAGNALAAAAALKALQIYERDNIFAYVNEISIKMKTLMTNVSEETKILKNIRCIGAICAADIILPDDFKGKRIGFEVYKKAVSKGALLRPLGNTIYWFPPLNSRMEILEKIAEITRESLNEVFSGKILNKT